MDTTDTGFGIQTAARRTGLSTHTLRVWEQRYGAVQVARSASGRRRYTPADLDRLRLLKRLVDYGERISRIAGFSDPELRDRIAELGLAPAPAADAGLAIAAWGESVPARLAQLPLDVRLVASCTSLEDFVAQSQRAAPQAIIVEFDNVTAHKLALLTRLRRALPGVPLAVIFGFARRRDITQLRELCDALNRAPSDLQGLVAQLVRAAPVTAAPAPARLPVPVTTGAPPRRYSPRQLDFLAARTTRIDCECPAHLVQLIRTLLAFERYSAACAQDEPAEAAIHQMLLETTAQSRRRLEDALAELAVHERIEVPD